MTTLTLSIVSHGQSKLLMALLEDLLRLSINNVELILTFNIPEDIPDITNLPFPVKIIKNHIPKGFGENHNAAFRIMQGQYFVIINPDIRIQSFDVKELLLILSSSKIGAVGPKVLNSMGYVEDSFRKFPTFLNLLERVIFRKKKIDYELKKDINDVDWIGGMFVIFNREAFINVNGFDSGRFFMYLEDVDICRRLWDSGWRVVVYPKLEVIHNAQRASRKSLTHLRWHVLSAIRYLSGI